MAELIDFLFFFWCGFTTTVFVLVSLYEKQRQAAKEAKEALERRRRSLDTAQWTPYLPQSSPNHQPLSSSQFNNYSTNLDYNYSSQPQYDTATTSHNARHQQQQQHGSAYLADSSPGISYQQPSFSYSSNNHYSINDGYNQHPYGNESIQPRGAFVQGEQDFYSSTRVPDSCGHSYNDFPPTNLLDQRDRHRIQLEDYNSIPTATGFNSDCVEWVNEILYLFFSQPQKYGSLIGESVYRSLNEKLANITSTLPEYNDLIVEFKGINMELSSRPELTNVRTESESDKSVSAICKIYNRQLVLDLVIRKDARDIQQSGFKTLDDHDKVIDAHYELVLENLEGKLKSMAMLNAKLIVIQFMEKPDTKILLRLNRCSHGMTLVNEDSLVQVILQSITQVVVDLYLGDDPEFPPFKHQTSSSTGYRSKLNMLKGSASEIKRQIKQDFFGVLSSVPMDVGARERKIFIKILKAKNINYNQNVTCLLELDSPKQQALSSTKQGNSNPYWDEHFLFNVGDKSSELVLELWDSISVPQEGNSLKRGSKLQQLKQQLQQQHSASSSAGNEQNWIKSDLTLGAKFLGLARVNIDELRKEFAGVQKLSLQLESRPLTPTSASGQRAPEATILAAQDLMSSNSVGGELQIELMFLEHSINSQTLSTSNTSSSLQKSHSASSLSSHQKYQAGGEVVSVDRKLTPSGYLITTTTISKPAGSRADRKRLVTRSSSSRNASPISGASNNKEQTDGRREDADDIDGSGGKQATDEHQDRGRSRSRSRSFLRAIRKRFSFSRTRTRSASESGATCGSGRAHLSRPSAAGGSSSLAASDSRPGSPSAGGFAVSPFNSRPTSRASSELSIGLQSGEGGFRAKSMPASRDLNEVPKIVINKSRLSDTGSVFTFTHPKSQLVIECLEPCLSADGLSRQKNQVKHYAISEEMVLANRGRWRKLKGLKLHVFNEHQFVACHLPASSTCHLCARLFSRRPGKQGYKCRNCHLLSHKQCHVKVDHNCPYASVGGLKLEYIDADPPASLVAEQQAAANASGGATRGSRAMKLGAKSISMEDR